MHCIGTGPERLELCVLLSRIGLLQQRQVHRSPVASILGKAVIKCNLLVHLTVGRHRQTMQSLSTLSCFLLRWSLDGKSVWPDAHYNGQCTRRARAHTRARASLAPWICDVARTVHSCDAPKMLGFCSFRLSAMHCRCLCWQTDRRLLLLQSQSLQKAHEKMRFVLGMMARAHLFVHLSRFLHLTVVIAEGVLRYFGSFAVTFSPKMCMASHLHNTTTQIIRNTRQQRWFSRPDRTFFLHNMIGYRFPHAQTSVEPVCALQEGIRMSVRSSHSHTFSFFFLTFQSENIRNDFVAKANTKSAFSCWRSVQSHRCVWSHRKFHIHKIDSHEQNRTIFWSSKSTAHWLTARRTQSRTRGGCILLWHGAQTTDNILIHVLRGDV